MHHGKMTKVRSAQVRLSGREGHTAYSSKTGLAELNKEASTPEEMKIKKEYHIHDRSGKWLTAVGQSS